MPQILVTGAQGFIGRHVVARLRGRSDVQLREFDLSNSDTELEAWATEAQIIVHLAGVNRPERIEEFEEGNCGFTDRLCQVLQRRKRAPHLLVTSSIQAELDNPYGASKRHAEQVLQEFAQASGARVSIFRLKNVFGKWCRPNYNSVVATFCHNIAHDLPIQINDPNRSVELVHVDDVVDAIVNEFSRHGSHADVFVPDTIPAYTVTLSDLAGRIQMFREMQQTLRTPDFSVRFNQQLYSTYLSYVPPARWEYGLEIKADARGSLAEFIKSPWFGQVFVSRTLPGITRGNHYHHVKTEKFFVIAGEGLIRFRHILGSEILEYHVRGEDYRVVEIPPGYTHSITNVGAGEMITLFWASEVFDPDRPDTYWMNVDEE